MKHVKHIKKKSIIKGKETKKKEIEEKSTSHKKIMQTSSKREKDEKFELSSKTKDIINKIKKKRSKTVE